MIEGPHAEPNHICTEAPPVTKIELFGYTVTSQTILTQARRLADEQDNPDATASCTIVIRLFEPNAEFFKIFKLFIKLWSLLNVNHTTEKLKSFDLNLTTLCLQMPLTSSFPEEAKNYIFHTSITNKIRINGIACSFTSPGFQHSETHQAYALPQRPTLILECESTKNRNQLLEFLTNFINTQITTEQNRKPCCNRRSFFEIRLFRPFILFQALNKQRSLHYEKGTINPPILPLDQVFSARGVPRPQSLDAIYKREPGDPLQLRETCSESEIPTLKKIEPFTAIPPFALQTNPRNTPPQLSPYAMFLPLEKDSEPEAVTPPAEIEQNKLHDLLIVDV